MTRNVEIELLHPVFREKVKVLIDKLAAENIPLRLFEGYRFAERQHRLYSQGRTAPGARVTKADAWQSYHQYGVACDFVLYIDGKWSWQTSGKFKKYWSRYQEIGTEIGLKALSWEKPHLQLHGLSLQDLQSGNYPEGGDESWAENLTTQIRQWTKGPTPPPPPLVFGRPALPDEEIEEDALPNTTSPSLNSYRVTARNGLRMRSGPGTDFDIVATLHANQRVRVLDKSGDWLQVDLEHDGLADGYCHGGFLAML
jgi:hypothetical protein